MSTVLKFKCPNCGSEKLIMAQSVVKGYTVTGIEELDDSCYSVDTGEEIDIDSMNVDCVLNYSCTDCGYLIEDDDGSPVDDEDVLGKWIKNNCPQE